MRQGQHILRVAVVDDDEAFSDSVAVLLESDGFEAQCYKSAEAFIERGCDLPFCCVLVDWMLPGMSGERLCRQLADSVSPPGLILMSAGRYNDGDAYRADAPFPFFRKPFDPDRLLAELERQCRLCASLAAH